jgi:hypothetical protein
MTAPSMPAAFRSLTIVCTSGSSGIFNQPTENRGQMSDDKCLRADEKKKEGPI